MLNLHSDYFLSKLSTLRLLYSALQASELYKVVSLPSAGTQPRTSLDWKALYKYLGAIKYKSLKTVALAAHVPQFLVLDFNHAQLS